MFFSFFNALVYRYIILFFRVSYENSLMNKHHILCENLIAVNDKNKIIKNTMPHNALNYLLILCEILSFFIIYIIYIIL